MTPSELANHDGREGRSTYVAVNGTIYDVSESPLWKNGHHPPNHQAGQDLTEELSKAPHVRALIERFPVVGSLSEEPSQTKTGKGNLMLVVIIAAVIIVGLAAFLL